MNLYFGEVGGSGFILKDVMYFGVGELSVLFENLVVCLLGNLILLFIKG